VASKYGDGKSCDCGCGLHDPDCKDASLGSCDVCNLLGGCARGPCPSDVVPDDNSRCALPPGWVCNGADYGDGVCDCGCGALDTDCKKKTADACGACPTLGCAQDVQCTGIDPNDNTICTSAPRTWKCDKSEYRDGSHCDCGCGFWDPDCSTHDLAACERCDSAGSCSHQTCPGTINPTANEACGKPLPPAGWTCSADSYADTRSCDCGCGVQDPDCRTNDANQCTTCACGHCPEALDPHDATKCAPAPAGWTCPPEEYASGRCHCGCGVMDPACIPYDYCIVCDGCAHGHCELIDSNDITKCAFDVPNTWTCPAATYGDGVCDCGCGAVDPICETVVKSSCDSCNTQGSCSQVPCDDPQSNINPTDNPACLK
jgi:hypothetical protein